MNDFSIVTESYINMEIAKSKWDSVSASENRLLFICDKYHCFVIKNIKKMDKYKEKLSALPGTSKWRKNRINKKIEEYVWIIHRLRKKERTYKDMWKKLSLKCSLSFNEYEKQKKLYYELMATDISI